MPIRIKIETEAPVTVCRDGENGFGTELVFYASQDSALVDNHAVCILEFPSFRKLVEWFITNERMIRAIAATPAGQIEGRKWQNNSSN